MVDSSSPSSASVDSPRFPVLGVLVLFVFGIAIGHCYWKGDILAATVCGIVLVGSFLGYCYGLWKTLGSSVGCFVGYQCAVPVSGTIQSFIERMFQKSLTATMATLIGGVLVGAAVILTFWIVGLLVFRRSAFLRRCDGVSGFIFGFANTALITAALLWGLLSLESPISHLAQSEASTEEQPAKVVAIRLNQLVTATKNSYLMLPLSTWNPWEEISYLQAYRDQMCNALTSTGKRIDKASEQATGLERLINHPKVHKLLGKGVENSNPIHGLEIVSEHAGTLVNKLLEGDLGKIK